MKTKDNRKIGIWACGIVGMKHGSDQALIHIKRAKKYAEYKGWEVVKQYTIPSNTTNNLRRIAIEEMLQDIKTGTIQVLIISKLARLSQNVKDLIFISEYFQRHNADLVSLSERIDTSASVGRLYFNLIASVSQWEYEEMNQRVGEIEKQNQVK